MKKLSVFVDESGDFGKSEDVASYYFVTLVFHDQNDDIHKEIKMLDDGVSCLGYDFTYLHTGPLIRREVPYRNMTIDERRKLLFKMRCFLLNAPIRHTTLKISRKESNDIFKLTSKISQKLKAFIDGHLEYFCSYDKIVIYYDNGQRQLNLILNTILNSILTDVEFKVASPEEYRLLQLADFICSMEFLSLKQKEKRLSKSETSFFYKSQELKKSFIKAVKSKEFI